MSKFDPIAYTYEADHHCEACALKRFGRCLQHGAVACCVEDSEGNIPGAIAPWDEWQHFDPEHPCEVLSCGTCLEPIEEYHDPEECQCFAEVGL